MNNEVLVKITALDETRAALKSVQGGFENLKESTNSLRNRLDNLQPTFQGMQRTGGIAFGAIAASLGLAVNEARKAEAAQFRLAQILRTATGATDEQISALNAQAEALEQVGVVSGEAITQAQAQLATFDLQAETIEKLTPAILDYVVAEKGASASTEDLKQMTNGLAQALNGNFASLTRVGFVLDDTTKELISNGTEAERAAALVQVLNSTYEGFNVAARSTAEGGLVALRNELGRLQETIGKEFLVAMEQVTATLQPIITTIIAWIEKNPELARNIILVTLAVTGLVAVVGTLGIALIAITSPIGLVVVAIGGISAAVYFLITAFNNFREMFPGVFELAKTTLTGFANFFIGIAEGIANSWIKAVNTIISALNSIQVSIPDWVPKIGGNSFGIDIPKIREMELPRLATGGIVTRPTIAEIGEAGPEAVIPLDRFGQFGGNTYNVYVSGTFLDDRAAARRMGDEIMRTLKLQARL